MLTFLLLLYFLIYDPTNFPLIGVRLGLIVILLICAVIVRKIVHLIQNARLVDMARRLFITFVVFALLRLVSAYLDHLLHLDEIGWFSAVVTYAFHLCILYLVWRLYDKFREAEFSIHKTGAEPERNPRWIDRGRVSTLADEILDELKVNTTKTNKLEKEMVSHLDETKNGGSKNDRF